MITTRNDLTAAKKLLDNLDQVTAAIANLGSGSTITVAITGRTNPFSVDIAVADAMTFLQAMQVNLTAALHNMGVTV